MKVTHLSIETVDAASRIDLALHGPAHDSPYLVKGITGLDADDILNTSLVTATLLSRDVVILMGLNPRYAIDEEFSDLRDRVYRFISANRTGVVKLKFANNQGPVAELSGLISKVEATHSTQEPEIKLTITCLDPFLKATSRVDVDVSTLSPTLFNISDSISTAPHGFKLVVSSLVAGRTNFKIRDGLNNSWWYEVTFTSPWWNVGQTVHLSSEVNDRHLYLNRSGTLSYYASQATLTSTFPMIYPGDNWFGIDAPSTVQIVSLSYLPTFWGV